MKGIRFYHELENKGKVAETSQGNVIAIFINTNSHTLLIMGEMYEGLVAVFGEPNSPVCVSGVSWEYLRESCKRISEAKARKIHPRLFERLDKT